MARKPFCKEVGVCEYLFLHGFCWGENITESESS